MPRKISPTLLNSGDYMYSILCPGKGYAKLKWGSLQFDDKLPRASMSFKTHDEALEMLSSLEKHNEDHFKALCEKYPWTAVEFWQKEKERNLENIKECIIVKIGVKSV